MAKILSVVPECYVETNMAKVLLNCTGVNHQYGCGAVTNAMTKSSKLKDGFAVGLIDDDKMKSRYANSFTLLETLEISEKAHVEFMNYEGTNHYLIITHPAMERLMIECAKSCEINMRNYNLPDNLRDLKKYTKDHQADDDANIKRLFQDLSNNVSCPLCKLKEALKYMVEQTYNIDKEVLKSKLR